jgi:hypothetical protein
LYHHRLVKTPVAASGPTAQMSVSPMAISHEGDLALHAQFVPLLEEGGQIAGRQPPSTTSGFAWRIFRMNEL